MSAYDLAGNRLTVAYPGGRALVSAYDAMNRLVTVTDTAKVTVYDYDHNGNRPIPGTVTAMILDRTCP